MQQTPRADPRLCAGLWAFHQGEVGLNSMCALPDFQVVDLLKRPIGLQGTTEVLMTDKFLFKAHGL